MKIVFKSNRLEKICTDQKIATRKHGKNMSDIIIRRMSEIEAAPNVDFLVKYRIGNCHPLKGNRKRQYGMDLVQPHRLVFEIINENNSMVRILEIVNYH